MLNKVRIKKTLDVAKKVSKKSNKNILLVIIDMLWCGYKYKAGYVDYHDLEMYNLTNKQRKTYLTWGLNLKYVRYFNNSDYYYIFLEKNIFNKTFNKYIKRDWIYLNNNIDDFKKFIKTKDKIFCKPNDGFGGIGMELINLKDYKDKDKLYNDLVDKKLLMIEEVIKQHSKLNELNPHSVNSIRIVSIRYNGKSNKVKALIRMGTGSSVVDNFTSGGTFAPVDIKTGVIEDIALNKNNDIFYKHPVTNTTIKGFQIPYWKEVIKLIDEVSKVVEEVRMVGFDIAITEEGPLLIEGNHYPGHSMYQRPIHMKDKIGILPEFEKIKKF